MPQRHFGSAAAPGGRTVSGPPLYVYGVLPAATPAAAHAGGIGVGGGAVTRVTSDDLAVLVSHADAAPVARTRRNLLAHTSVLERAMPHATVLPLRFATVVPGAAALTACLDANRAAFRAALRDIDGQVELGVKAIWRSGLVFTDIVERDQALRQLRDRLRTRPASETYYERIELGRRVEAALAERRGSESNAILEELLPLAERVGRAAAARGRYDIQPRLFSTPRNGTTLRRGAAGVGGPFRGPHGIPLRGPCAAVQFRDAAGRLAHRTRHGRRLMGAVGSLLGLPVTGPLLGLGWLARRIAEAAEAEMNNPAQIEAELLALERQLEAGEIDEAAYEAREAQLLETLQTLAREAAPATDDAAGTPDAAGTSQTADGAAP